MTDFQLRFEQYQGGGGPLTAANDDTAANNLALRCKDGGWRSQAFDGYGDWSQAISCPSGQGYTRKNWIAYKAKDVRSAFMNFMKQI